VVAKAKELENAQKEWRKLEGQSSNCQAHAEKALEQFNLKWKVHQATVKAVAVRQYLRCGRPTAEDQREVVGYHLDSSLALFRNYPPDNPLALKRGIQAAESVAVIEPKSQHVDSTLAKA